MNHFSLELMKFSFFVISTQQERNVISEEMYKFTVEENKYAVPRTVCLSMYSVKFVPNTV